MPENLKSIYISEISWRDGSEWVVPTAKNNANPEELLPMTGAQIVIYHTDTPIYMPSIMQSAFNSSGFTVKDQSVPSDTWTLYHASGGGIPLTKISPLIRYKLTVVTTDGTDDTERTNPEFYYCMLKAGFSSDPWSGAGSSPASSGGTAVKVNLRFYFPAFNAIQVGGQEYEYQKSLLENNKNWEIQFNDRKFNPDSASILQIITNPIDVAAYGVGKAWMSLNSILQIQGAGVYPITVKFKPKGHELNNFDIPGSHTLTATLNAYIGTAPEYAVSSGPGAWIYVTISQ